MAAAHALIVDPQRLDVLQARGVDRYDRVLSERGTATTIAAAITKARAAAGAAPTVYDRGARFARGLPASGTLLLGCRSTNEAEPMSKNRYSLPPMARSAPGDVDIAATLRRVRAVWQ